MNPTSILAQWREMSRKATEAENIYFEAAMAYASGKGPEPSEDLAEYAKSLREESKALFQLALLELQIGDSGFVPIRHNGAGGSDAH